MNIIQRKSCTPGRRELSGYFLACLMLYSAYSTAGGLEVPDLGTVAIGRGTAFVARADNGSAFYYNPAGLSKGKGVNVLVIGNAVHMDAKFQRKGSGGTRTINGVEVDNPDQDYSEFPQIGEFDSVSLQSNFGPAPALVASWCGVGDVDGLALSFGVLPPASFGTPSYPHDGPQRYAMREAHFLMLFPGVGISYAVNRYFQVGAVFLSGVGFFEQDLAIRPVFQKGIYHKNEYAGGDANLKIDAKDWFMPTGIIGVMSNPLDWLEIGASVRIPIYIEATGHIKYDSPEVDLPDSHLVEGEDAVTLSQHFPWVVRTGARYIHEYFDFEVDFVWENWSSLKGFDLDMDAELNDGLSIQPMPDSKVRKNFRDTYSIRYGGDVEVWPENIAVRVGGFWQSSAFPENYETFNLDFPFGEQIGVGGGLTWHAADFLDVNAGYMHVFQLDVEVTEGIIQQQGLPWEDPSDGEEKDIGNTVNNGTYEVSMNLFGVSLEGHF